MHHDDIEAIAAWLIEAGLAGMDETDLLHTFCERCRDTGLDLARGLAIVDTLHPTFEGRVFRWRLDGPIEAPVIEYGRTTEGEAAEMWRQSVFHHLQSENLPEWHGRYDRENPLPYSQLESMRDDGYTSVLALIHRFAGEGTYGEMECVYSYWTTKRAGGFDDADLAALRRLLPPLVLAIKCRSLARITNTVAEVYLGRGAGRRVLGGRILRGVAERMEAVLWFSDLRGFTAITDQAEAEEVIPLLNDYADAVITAVHDQGGDVLKLVGDGVLAIFETADPTEGCRHALAAETAVRLRIDELNAARAAVGKPTTSVYLGLHFGDVFFGNIGSKDRLDFTVVGPSVNEVSRIASLCRSVDRTVLLSSRFADLIVASDGHRLASVGRYALRGIRRSQELFTLDDRVGGT